MSRALATPKLKRAAPILVLALTVLLGFNTWARAFVWGNGELWLRTQYQQRPDSPRVLSGLFGLELRRGNIEAARRYIRETQRLEPDSPLHLINELRTYCTAEVYPEELVKATRLAIERNARAAAVFGALDSLTSDYLEGKCQTPGFQVVYGLVTTFVQSSTLTSSHPRFLALILQGRLLISKERWEDAEAAFARALDLAEGKPFAFTNLTVNELFRPFIQAGQIDSLARLLLKVAGPDQSEYQFPIGSTPTPTEQSNLPK